MRGRFSMLLKFSATPDILSSRICNKKILQFSTYTTPLSNDTIDSFLRHWEVCCPKDILAPQPKTEIRTVTIVEIKIPLQKEKKQNDFSNTD